MFRVGTYYILDHLSTWFLYALFAAALSRKQVGKVEL